MLKIPRSVVLAVVMAVLSTTCFPRISCRSSLRVGRTRSWLSSTTYAGPTLCRSTTGGTIAALRRLLLGDTTAMDGVLPLQLLQGDLAVTTARIHPLLGFPANGSGGTEEGARLLHRLNVEGAALLRPTAGGRRALSSATIVILGTALRLLRPDMQISRLRTHPGK